MSSIRDIVHKAGGPRALARKLASSARPVSEDAVFKWYRNGIPEEHLPTLIEGGDTTVQELYLANAELRRSRAGNVPAAA